MSKYESADNDPQQPQPLVKQLVRSNTANVRVSDLDEKVIYSKEEMEADLSFFMIFTLLLSMFFSFFVSISQCLVRVKKTKQVINPYPDMVNLHVLRIVDFMAAIGMFASMTLTTVTWLTGLDSISMQVFTGISVCMLFMDKFLQVANKPGWKTHRILAYKIFGNEFLPVGSSGRRAQQLIFACETVMVFDPIIKLIFNAAGASRNAGYIFLVSYKAFMLFFYLAMATVAWCPVWGFAGWMTKLGFISAPKGDISKATMALLPKKKPSRLSKSANYFFEVDEEKGKLTNLRYGLWGPTLGKDILSKPRKDSKKSATVSPA